MKQIAPAFCTVVTNRYIPYARVLARRLAACHKGATLFALLADEDEGRFDDEPFELVRLADLADAGAVDFVGLRDMAFYYGPFELCNAVRPLLHRFMYDCSGRDKWFYLDSDIWVIDSLAPLFDELNDASILLSPHCLEPPLGRFRLQARFLRYGIFNSGFLGLRKSEETDRFLTWWSEAMRWFCVTNAPFQADQPWLEFVPAFFPGAKVGRHPGANVGYWNIHERQVERTKSGFTSNGRPWLFAHLSGLDLGNYDRLSNWAKEYDGQVPPAWEEVHKAYHAALLEEGLDEAAGFPYGFARFSDGSKISTRMRNQYREDCRQGNGLREKSPFDCARDFRRRAIGGTLSDVVSIQVQAGKYLLAPQTRPVDLKKIA